MGARKSKKPRSPIALCCTVCGARNKKTTRSPEKQGQLSLNKFCPACNRHTLHIESK